jgi:hypothetical protein
MNLPEPQSVTFTSLFAEIENGTIKIPQFQRDFVWSKSKSAKLLDSIVKGYPIGTFILWKTNERLRSIRNLGGVALPQTPKGDAVKYVLDGQQRLTSLFVSLKGLKITREEHEEDFAELWVDLAVDEHAEIVLMEVEGRNKRGVIQLKDLLSGDFSYLASFGKAAQDRIRTYKNRIESYQFSAILIKEAPIDVATEIFTRLNVGGEPLSVFEIMVAKTYDPDKNFDLAEKFNELVAELESVEYETLSSATVLQTMSVLLRKDCRKKEILNLAKNDVVAIWPQGVEAIRATVDYFRNYYRIPASRLLPYPALVIPFAYYFFKHPDKPTGSHQRYLQDFFWRVALGGRYSQGLENRIAQDIQRMDQILEDKAPEYDWAVDVSPEFIRTNGYFSTSRSFIKAILCVLAHKEPKSFVDNSIVRLDNAFLKQANSKNYHHFFPRSWLYKEGWDDAVVNHVANITLVDDFLNKRLIRAQSPKNYMKSFISKNPDIRKCMATHLIKLDAAFGVIKDDYDKFFQARCRAISHELGRRIIPRTIDQSGQARSAEETVVEEDEWSAA